MQAPPGPAAPTLPRRPERCVQVLVIGSGAGGAVTALELARAGLDVCILEEGSRWDLKSYGRGSVDAMRHLYRRRGMTPILGAVPMGYVEGACVGGSTEINSGFWHRTPREVLLRYKAQFDLQNASADELSPHFSFAEGLLDVGLYDGPLPKSTDVFARGIRAMGWAAQEVPRAAPGCQSTNACATGCPTGAKQGMSRAVIPAAEAAGARLVPNCSVRLLLLRGDRVTGVLAELRRDDGQRELVRIDADHVFVCAGPTEGPALLRRSGIKRHVGDSLRLHPMLKVAAEFPERIDAQESVLPLLQVKEFWPEISLGGAFFTPGHLSLVLSENWRETSRQMGHYRNMATYYVAVRGSGRGSVRPSLIGDGGPIVRYELSEEDAINLSKGLARLATLLLAAGASQVHPTVHNLPTIRNEVEAVRWLDERIPRSALSLTTVHAFSSCPIGERQDRCAANSFGKVFRYENLYVNDASMLPDSPGVNPQASVMALARRNAVHFRESLP
jgi:choline dehydrogenase-like flavoprotein